MKSLEANVASEEIGVLLVVVFSSESKCGKQLGCGWRSNESSSAATVAVHAHRLLLNR